MVPLPFSVGPSDDWDPQGYEEEEEDTLAPGMHVLDEDEEEEKEGEDAVVEEGVVVDEEAEDEEVDETGLEDLDKDPIEELDELENRVLETERATLRLSDFTDDE